MENVFDLVKVEDNLPPAQRIEAVREAISRLSQLENASHIITAELLTEVKENKYWEIWGYKNLNEYIETELGFTAVKGRYLIKVYTKFHKELGLEKEELRRYEWSKLAVISKIATPTNYKNLLQKTKDMSIRELTEYIKDMKEEEKTEEFKKIIFKVNEEQLETINVALQEAQKITGSDKGGNLLELICAEFISHRIDNESIYDYLQKIIKTIEANVGVKLAVLDDKGNVFTVEETNAENQNNEQGIGEE